MGGFRTGLVMGLLIAAVIGLSLALILKSSGGTTRVAAPQTATPTGPTSDESRVGATSTSDESGNGPVETAPTPTPQSARPASSVLFSSPSENIVCKINLEDATCGILDFDYSVPPEPDGGCDYPGWGQTFSVTAYGTGQMICASQPPGNFGTNVLQYGRMLRLGSFQCDSMTSGVTCENRKTGHGFFVSQGQYRTY